MCTAATYKTEDFYFGRTLDYEFSYGDEITVTPRNYPFEFRSMGGIKEHYAMVGMAHVADNFPLYYDAMNERGLCIAGLNFVGNAHYRDVIPGKDNVAQYELIPWLLAQCGTVREARALLEKINITNIPFSDKLPCAQLHWIVADKTEAITVESVEEGIRIYDLERVFPAAFVKTNSLSGSTEQESFSQFFHILGAVDQQRGCCHLGEGKYEITIYTSCCNADKGIYYYNTYENHQISAVDMHREQLDGSALARYKPITGEQIKFQN